MRMNPGASDGKRMPLSSFIKGTDAIYKMPTGELYLGLEIEYYYKGVAKSLGGAIYGIYIIIRLSPDQKLRRGGKC